MPQRPTVTFGYPKSHNVESLGLHTHHAIGLKVFTTLFYPIDINVIEVLNVRIHNALIIPVKNEKITKLII